MILVLHRQVQQHPLADQHLGEGREEPGTQAVGIERRDHHQRGIAAFGQIGQQVGFQQRGTFEVLQQTLPSFGGPTWPAAHHQRAAERALQRANPLRDGRRGQVQTLRCLLEAAGTDDAAKRLGLLWVEIHAVRQIRKCLYGLKILSYDK